MLTVAETRLALSRIFTLWLAGDQSARPLTVQTRGGPLLVETNVADGSLVEFLDATPSAASWSAAYSASEEARQGVGLGTWPLTRARTSLPTTRIAHVEPLSGHVKVQRRERTLAFKDPCADGCLKFVRVKVRCRK